MRYIFSEESVNYKNYKFGYTVNVLLDKISSIEKCLDKGFLPYTGDLNQKKEIYYLARSLRVDTSLYQRLSENLRVIKKAKKNHNINFVSQNKDTFLHNISFKNFCMNYSKQRFSNNPLSEKRLDLILKRDNYNKIFTFFNNEEVLGYVLTYENNNILHYWFSFYNTNLLNEFNVGKYMMEQIIFYAKQNNKKYVYLGTCYGEKSLYKARDFKGIEYFDGSKWSKNLNVLKDICKADII